jgi:hypothetical protein
MRMRTPSYLQPYRATLPETITARPLLPSDKSALFNYYSTKTTADLYI